MKHNLFTRMIFILLFGGLAACQPAAGEPLKMTEKDAGKTITLKTGDILLIELRGNITTGFNWIPAMQDPILLNQIDQAEETSDGELLGAPGLITLRFEAVATGQTVLHLDYKRTWETDITPEKTFEVTVVVE